MKIYVMRHGETDYNRQHRFQGQIDIPLNDMGRQEAREANKRIKDLGLAFDRIYCSPLSRAIETVEIAAGVDRSQIIIEPRVEEINFDELDRTPFSYDATDCGCLFSDPEHFVPARNGESFHDVEKRFGDFLLELQQKKPGRRILVGSHGGAMRCMLAFLHYISLDDIWHQGIGNCQIVEITVNDDEDTAPAGLRGYHGMYVTNMFETQDIFMTTVR